MVLAYLLGITTLIVSVGRLGDITAGGCYWPILVFSRLGPVRHRALVAGAARGAGPRAAVMMLTMALVGETVPKAKLVAPWVCSERCPRLAPLSVHRWRRFPRSSRFLGTLPGERRWGS